MTDIRTFKANNYFFIFSKYQIFQPFLDKVQDFFY